MRRAPPSRVPEWVTRAILSHADYSGVARESLLEKTLYACDEMAGFVTAAALVRPSKSILDLEAASVLKRMKDKAFARAVSRDDLRRGAAELGLPLEEHVANVITFMRESRRRPRPPRPSVTRHVSASEIFLLARAAPLVCACAIPQSGGPA